MSSKLQPRESHVLAVNPKTHFSIRGLCGGFISPPESKPCDDFSKPGQNPPHVSVQALKP